MIVALIGCQTKSSQPQLQEGDLLFQDLDCGALCDAIEAVTEGVDGKDFSHCGMVVLVDDTLKVIEAIGEGVQLNSLEDFYKRSGSTDETITVARVKNAYRELIDEASEFAIARLEEGYDEPFHLDNGKWYCSELLYESFKSANGGSDFFELAPMTFKDPETKEFFPAWVEYYDELGEEIPEGELGLNPGSISRSKKIDIISAKIISEP
ncbi:MAG: YiiX/YebB-like N1pC/P60 family cysteine hydrolase [Bacteroidota bacterium]